MIVRKVRVALMMGVVGVTLLAPVGASNAATPRWSGNAAAIALYRQAVAATNALATLQDVYHGYYWMWDNATALGDRGSFNLRWGYATKPVANMVAATATEVIHSAAGKQSWYTVVFTPTCASGSNCVSSMKPIEFYIAPGGGYWGFAKSAGHVSCWNRAARDAPWINKDFVVSTSGTWSTYGHFLPLITRGNQILVTSTYVSHQDGATVTETDSINASTKLFTGSTYRVSRSTHPVYAAHRYAVVETDLTSSPSAPVLHLCR